MHSSRMVVHHPYRVGDVWTFRSLAMALAAAYPWVIFIEVGKHAQEIKEATRIYGGASVVDCRSQESADLAFRYSGGRRLIVDLNESDGSFRLIFHWHSRGFSASVPDHALRHR